LSCRDTSRGGLEEAMNSKNLPISKLEEGWTIGIGWTRKLVIAGGILNILALLLIILNIVNFSPISLLASLSIGGIFMGVAILLYVVLVIIDLRRRGIL